MKVSIPPSENVTAAGKPFRERWEDLLPEQDELFDDIYSRLTAEQLADLAMMARMVRLLETGKADAGGSMAQNASRIRQAFAQDGLDADWLLSQRTAVRESRVRRSINPEVEGKLVRLFGIMLPLAWDQNIGVTDFLLTATLGTCSHMPPPPFNQVAHVRTDHPIDVTALTKEQGTPDPWVWVEGTIQYGVSTHLAYRGDGMMRVEAAYAIKPVAIIPANPNELARRAEQARQEAEALLFPSLTDLVTRP